MTSKARKSGDHLTICVFIDALGWEIVQRHSFLNDLLIEKKPLDTVFGYSSSCDPTIITGKMPRDHGHFTFFTYDPENSPFDGYRYFALLPKFLMERGRVRAKFSQIMKRVHGFSGYFQLYNMPFKKLHLFDYTEKANIFEPGGINGGQRTIFDDLREHKIPFCRPTGYVESESIVEAEAAIGSGDVPFVFLFLGRLDALLHEHGTSSPIVSEHIAWYENQIRRLYEKATTTHKDVHLFIFSDHGMTDVIEVCDVKRRIEGLGLKFGEDYAAVYDSTMVRFWFLRPGTRETIVEALKKEPLGRILLDEELAEYGCDFSDNAYGELFFLMDPGVLICPSDMGVKPLAGMHGYSPLNKDSTAAFLSNIEVEPCPRRLDDLYSLMRREIGRPE